MKEKKKILLLLVSGALALGASVTFSRYLGFIEWVAAIPLCIALYLLSKRENLKLRHAYAYGLLYFECYYCVCFHWFTYLYPLDFTGLDNFSSILAIIVAWFGLSFLQALFGGFMFVVYIIVTRTSFAKKMPATKPFLIPVIYTFYEFTQTLGWWGVPWGRIPLGQSENLLSLQTSSLFGSYLITFVILLVNSLLAFAVINVSEISKLKKYALFALAVYALNLGTGSIIYLKNEQKAKDADTVCIGVVQGNYDSTDKWSASASEITYKHLELAKSCVDGGAEIIVFAETALPFNLGNSKSSERLSDFARENSVTLLVGALYDENGETYNAIYRYAPDGTVAENMYFKQRLVPFGEFVLMRKLTDIIFPFLSELSILKDDMTPGSDSDVYVTNGGIAVGSLICFDSIYESLAIDSVRNGAEIFAISTNDSWFSDSAGIYMHNNQARLRSIELGRYTVRSANTGVSSFITDTGRVLGEISPLEEGYLCYDVVPSSSRTIYSYIGNTFVYICGILTFLPIIRDIVVAIYKRFCKTDTKIKEEDSRI